MEYYKEELLNETLKQKKKTIKIYFLVLACYLLASIVLFLWFRIQTYNSKTIKWIKFIHYTLSLLMLLFTFIYIGVKYKRVKSFYRALDNVKNGIRETYEAEFIGYEEKITYKEGVEYKALLFKEWNKYKKDFYERKVLVFYELDFPEIEKGKKVKFVTQSNLLVEYEYITEDN